MSTQTKLIPLGNSHSTYGEIIISLSSEFLLFFVIGVANAFTKS